MDYLEIVKKYKNDIIKSLKEIIEIPSYYDESSISLNAPFGKSIKDALDYYLNLGKKENFNIKNIDNYCGYIEYGNKNLDMLGILGHLDVVPATGNWKFDPFAGIIDDNKLYGRGAIDDKGPAILAFYALKIIKDLNIKLNKRVRIIVGCDEELNMRCLNHYINKNEELPKIGFTPDADFPVIYGEKGIVSTKISGFDYSDIISFNGGERLNLVPDLCSVKLKIDLKNEFLNYLKENNLNGEIKDDVYYMYGVSSHAMQPEKGINACILMATFLNKYIKSDFLKFIFEYLSFDHYGEKLNLKTYDPDMLYLTSNPGMFKLENNHFLIGINYRVPKNECINKIEEESLKAVNKYNFKFEMLSKSNVHIVDKNSFLVKTLYDSYLKYTNDKVNKPFTIGGGTYARMLKNNVAFGPSFIGDVDCVHQVNEFIDIDKALLTCAIYIEAIVRLCA